MADVIGPGDRLALWHANGRRFLLTVGEGTQRVAGLGVVRDAMFTGKSWGDTIRLGDADFTILPPTLGDSLVTLERKAQLVLPKDSSRILLECAIGPGTRVAEAGAGSGGITLVLAHAVGRDGHVYAYDVRGDHLSVARTNLTRAGLADRVTLTEGDIAEVLDEEPLDAIVLDVPDPERVVAAVAGRLAVGGTIACYTPLVSQMEAARQTMEELRLGDVRSLELIERRWINRGRGSRPDMDMLGHTGFLTFGRRVRA